MPCGRLSWRVLTGNIFGNDVFIRLPDCARFVFGNLAWGPVPTHRMWVGLSRFTGIAHEHSSSVWRTSSAVKAVYDRACRDNGYFLFEYSIE